jgi:hypothetical protein
MATLAQSGVRRSGFGFRPMLALGLAAGILTALVQSFLLSIDCDVSWLITVNEKLLAGQRIYVDVIEVNPPASIWLYTPAVWFAGWLHVRPEATVVAAFILLAFATSALAVRISAKLRQPPNPLVLFGALCFVELLLPMGTFAQREHAALFFAVPALAALAVLAEGRPLSPRARVMAGVAAGLVIALKPHFALAIVPAGLFAVWKSRSVKPMIALGAAALTVVLAYLASILAFTPEYLKLLPVLAQTYMPLRERWSILLLGPVVIVPLATYVLGFALRPARTGTLPWMFLIGSAGFVLAALIQGKGYLNHALPGIGLGFVGLALLATTAGVEPGRRRIVVAAGAALACLELYAMACIRPIPGLAEAVTRVAPPRPSVITLGPNLLTGHPLVRNVSGRWAGSRAALFIAAGAHARLPAAPAAAKANLRRWYEDDLAAFAGDVQRERPDVILVDARPELAWLSREPVVGAVTAPYARRARVGDVEIWVRRQSSR